MEESQEAQQCSASPPILLCHGIGISIFKILCSLLVMKLSSPAFISSTLFKKAFCSIFFRLLFILDIYWLRRKGRVMGRACDRLKKG